MPVVWDEKAVSKLLLCILATSTKVDVQAISKLMGGEFNPLAISNRIKKVKLKAKGMGIEVPTPPNTPTKRATGKQKDVSADGSDAEDKPPAPKKARKRAVKAEDAEERKAKIEEEES